MEQFDGIERRETMKTEFATAKGTPIRVEIIETETRDADGIAIECPCWKLAVDAGTKRINAELVTLPKYGLCIRQRGKNGIVIPVPADQRQPVSEIFKAFSDRVKANLDREIGAIEEAASHHERVRRAMAE